MNQQLIQHLDEVVLFVLDVRLFHGNRKLKSHDLSEALQVTVPTDEVFSLGIKRVFDKEWVNKLTRVKSAMERECNNIGPRFEGLGGFAIPEDKADDLAGALDTLVAQGDALKADILSRFAAICDDYAKAHPKWSDVISKNAFSEAYVRNQIHYGYRCIKVKAARDTGPIADGLAKEVGGLLGNLLTSVSKAAKRFIEESLTGKEAVTRKALRPLGAAREKLNGFKFLDSRVAPLCTMIDKVIDSMPDEGKIEGHHLANLIGMASILLNSKTALDVGDKVVARDPDAVFAEMFQTGPLAAAAVTQPLEQTTPLSPLLVAVTPIQIPGVHADLAAVAMPALPQPAAGLDYSNLFAS